MEALPSRGAQRSPERSSQVASRGTSKAALLSKLTLLCELRVVCQHEVADALAVQRGDGAAARAQHLLDLQKSKRKKVRQKSRDRESRRWKKSEKNTVGGESDSADTHDLGPHILGYIITC